MHAATPVIKNMRSQEVQLLKNKKPSSAIIIEGYTVENLDMITCQLLDQVLVISSGHGVPPTRAMESEHCASGRGSCHCGNLWVCSANPGLVFLCLKPWLLLLTERASPRLQAPREGTPARDRREDDKP